MRILVVVAHPDDETIEMGGSLHRFREEGHAIRVVFLTDGEGIKPEPNPAFRRSCALNALRCFRIGEENADFLDFEDQKLDRIGEAALVSGILPRVLEFEPEVVYTHAPDDPNGDHRKTFEAVRVATARTRAPSVRSLQTFGVSRRFGQRFVSLTPENLDAKIRALACYSSEIRRAPHPRSPEGVRFRATWFGHLACLNLAEIFSVEYEIV